MNSRDIGRMNFSSHYKKSNKILFLGYDTNSTRLIKDLEVRGYDVTQCENNICFDTYHLAISFGYGGIYYLAKSFRLCGCPIINLHMSFLPYNGGAHPIFWAFYDQNKCGITIHELNAGIDTGTNYFWKKIEIDDRKFTFAQAHKRLKLEIEEMFLGKH